MCSPKNSIDAENAKRSKWIAVTEKLPTPEESAGFGGVECILQCVGSHNAQGMRFAKPIFIGGDPDRVAWQDANKAGEGIIENTCWVVTHWRPFPRFPEPIPAQEPTP